MEKAFQILMSTERRRIWAADTVVVTGTKRFAPETELNLDPGPIKVREKVVASFEIE